MLRRPPHRLDDVRVARAAADLPGDPLADLLLRRVWVAIEQGSVLTDRKRSPEETAFSEERSELMWRILGALSSRDREILTRFYLQEESQEKICQEMELTETQFRLLKSRAKARFGELGKRKLESRQQNGGRNILARTFDRLRH